MKNAIRESVRRHVERVVGEVYAPEGHMFKSIIHQWTCPTCGFEVRNYSPKTFERMKRKHICIVEEK